METHWGLLSVQERREETFIYDVEVVVCNAMTKSKNTNKSSDVKALLETHWGLLIVKEHREETFI